jgi:hypothetical protein
VVRRPMREHKDEAGELPRRVSRLLTLTCRCGDRRTAREGRGARVSAARGTKGQGAESAACEGESPSVRSRLGLFSFCTSRSPAQDVA